MTRTIETENEFGRGKVLSWASVIDPLTREQAERTSRSPILAGHLALMPDAHLGSGATVGSVLVTEGGIIPAAVGVDIGCGMVAVQTGLLRSEISKRDEHLLLGYVREFIPNGVGQNHKAPTLRARTWFAGDNFARGLDSPALQARAMNQFGTLGSGNHFAEFSEDEQSRVWAIVHSGSRGTGLALAEHHIAIAQGVCPVPVEDPNLAFLLEGTPEFDAYIADMTWAQNYARSNRMAMMEVLMDAMTAVLGADTLPAREVIDCHHNYAVPFDLEGKSVWLTRKGAIDASVGRLGVIPGSMGTDTYIVEGLGNVDSYLSAPHGAGRNFSRGQARRTLNLDAFVASMGDRTWGDRDARALLDESPLAYKDINVVMADAASLVRPLHRLTSFINFKAADGRKH